MLYACQHFQRRPMRFKGDYERKEARRLFTLMGSFLASLVLTLTVLAACGPDDQRHDARKSALTDQLDDLAKETVYFRDHAGVCWGIVWAGSHHGGPAGGPVPGVGPSDPCPPVPKAT